MRKDPSPRHIYHDAYTMHIEDASRRARQDSEYRSKNWIKTSGQAIDIESMSHGRMILAIDEYQMLIKTGHRMPAHAMDIEYS
jgi:hypothetical protein